MPQKYKQNLHENDIRLRYLYLYRILEQYTDAEHPKTTNELRAIMEEQHGIHLHRTTVYNDMELLQKAGIPVKHIRKRNNQYYLASRQFEVPELKLLIDAVESSRFLTEEQSRMLVDKLITLTSETNVDKLKRNLHVTGRVKAENTKLFEIIDTINEAIRMGKRISFRYIDYNSRKQSFMRHNGRPYYVSPYTLVWNGDYYYLVGKYHRRRKICSFRIDRIKEQPVILKNKDAEPQPEDFDITRYTREVFRMYDAEEAVPVTLICANEVMKGVLDAFGMDIKVKKVDDDHFQTTVMACTSPTFYAWVFQWEGRVRIAAPEEAVKKYQRMKGRTSWN